MFYVIQEKHSLTVLLMCLGKTQSLSSLHRWLAPLLCLVQSGCLCWVPSDWREWPSTRSLFQQKAQPPHFKRSQVKENLHCPTKNGKQIPLLYLVTHVVGIIINFNNLSILAAHILLNMHFQGALLLMDVIWVKMEMATWPGLFPEKLMEEVWTVNLILLFLL